MKVEVKQKIEVYEINDEDVPIGKTETMSVDSHWNRDEFVVLGFRGKRLTVTASNLQDAIRNATNTGI